MRVIVYLKKIRIIILLTAILFLAGLTLAQDNLERDKVEVDPIKGISITLPVYSGMPNPQWWYTEGPVYDTLVLMIKALKAVPDTIFNYDEWNRPGYAAFRVHTREIRELPKRVRIWRDMVYIPEDGEKPALYAKGGGRIYDFLVRQAEERGYKEFFVNYHKAQKDKR